MNTIARITNTFTDNTTRISVLEHGYVMPIDTMGDDQAIVDAARVSYGDGTRHTSNTEGLIRYLMRHRHTSPFEMCELKFEIQAPMFVARQWFRHRMASVNEYSGRYSEMLDIMYEPGIERMVKQHKTNRQGSGDEFVDDIDDVHACIEVGNESARNNYKDLLSRGLNRETARSVLNMNQYTKWVWKIDLHNLLHFLSLRMGEDAQWEIRQYANTIGNMVAELFPLTWKAFEDYRLCGASFSKYELEMLGEMAKVAKLDDDMKPGTMSKSEWREFREKLKC